MRDHGNYDYDHGYIRPEGVHKLEFWNGTPFRRQEVDRLCKEINGDRFIFTPSKQVAYCQLSRRGYGGWHHQRKQNTSSFMIRRYKSAANKKTRQWLREETIKELNDLNSYDKGESL